MLFTYSVFSTSGIVFPNTDLSAGEYHIFINNLFMIFFNKKVSFEENINSNGFSSDIRHNWLLKQKVPFLPF